MTSPASCPYCGTRTGIHGFSFGKKEQERVVSAEADRKKEKETR